MPQRLAQHTCRYPINATVAPNHASKRSSIASLPHSPEGARVAQSKSVKPVNAHHLRVGRVPGEIKPHHNDEIRKHQYTPLEVIALPLTVHIAQQEHAENHSHHVPLRKDETEGVIEQVLGTDISAMYRTEEHQRRDLKETDLQGIG